MPQDAALRHDTQVTKKDTPAQRATTVSGNHARGIILLAVDELCELARVIKAARFPRGVERAIHTLEQKTVRSWFCDVSCQAT